MGCETGVCGPPLRAAWRGVPMTCLRLRGGVGCGGLGRADRDPQQPGLATFRADLQPARKRRLVGALTQQRVLARHRLRRHLSVADQGRSPSRHPAGQTGPRARRAGRRSGSHADPGPRETRGTSACARCRSTMTLKSRQGPAISVQSVSQSPENAYGWCGCERICCRPGPLSSRMPAPSRSTDDAIAARKARKGRADTHRRDAQPGSEATGCFCRVRCAPPRSVRRAQAVFPGHRSIVSR